jgi:hemerythrin superfamily protein
MTFFEEIRRLSESYEVVRVAEELRKAKRWEELDNHLDVTYLNEMMRLVIDHSNCELEVLYSAYRSFIEVTKQFHLNEIDMVECMARTVDIIIGFNKMIDRSSDGDEPYG